MDRPSLRWWALTASVAGLSLAFLLSPVHAAQTSTTTASPVPVECGTAISAWGPATVDDIQIGLLSIVRDETIASPSPRATPSAAPLATYFAEIEVMNLSDVAANVVAHDITILLCDGTVLNPINDQSRTPLGDVQVPAGEVRSGWVAFAIPAEAVPVRLIVPVPRPGMSGGRVEFPLVDSHSTSGTTGAVGADAVGGDAVGGDGADGADATAQNET